MMDKARQLICGQEIAGRTRLLAGKSEDILRRPQPPGEYDDRYCQPWGMLPPNKYGR